jgi:hypothetical protein
MPALFVSVEASSDGIFLKQKSKVGLTLEELAMEAVGIFYGHY